MVSTPRARMARQAEEQGWDIRAEFLRSPNYPDKKTYYRNVTIVTKIITSVTKFVAQNYHCYTIQIGRKFLPLHVKFVTLYHKICFHCHKICYHYHKIYYILSPNLLPV